MITIVACAIAIDGLYDLAKPHAKLDEATIKGWKRRRKARANQVSEVFRRAFRLNPDETQRCLSIVEQTYRLRDRAVHPSLEIEHAIQREDIGVGVDWRFVAYSAANARTAFDNVHRLFFEFVERSRGNSNLSSDMFNLKNALQENGIE
jgi:hypothetical protein